MNTFKPTQPLILLIFANDPAQPLDEIQQEMQSLQTILQPVAGRLQYDIQILEFSSVDALIQHLDDNRERLILLHFAGHSNSEVLKLDEGVAHASGLVDKLRACQHLQLLFLNGCNNARQVQQFVKVGIPATIGTSFPIVDKVAREFSENFYTELAKRRVPVSVAFGQARATITTKEGDQHRTLNVRSLDESVTASTQQQWAWFLEQTNKHDWKLEEAAHPCSRLPVLPPKAAEALPAEPFKNLYYYQPDDAEIFFGRCQPALDVLERLDDGKFPLLLLHGGTGVGKSSFLMAGLIPRLRARAQPVAEPFRYDERITLPNLLPHVFGSDELAMIRHRLDTAGGLPKIWILDQLEEIFFKTEAKEGNTSTACMIRKEEQQDNIPDALNLLLKTLQALFPHEQPDTWPNARIILSLRTEWFGELHDACRQYHLASQDYLLKPLGKNDIIEIIEQPAKVPLLVEKYGLQIQTLPDGRLAEQIADDLLEDKESNIAPPLQIMLSKLWQRVAGFPPDQRLWTQELYEQQKAQGLLLSEHLDQQLREIGELPNAWGKRAHDSGLLLDVLHAHTTPQGTAKTLAVNEYNNRYAHIPYREVLAKTFTDRYLLVDPLNNKQQLRLAHDTLAGVVKARYDTSDLPGQRAQRVLDSRKADWKIVDDKPNGTALDTYDLKLVERGREGTQDWQQDSLETAIVHKSRRRRRNGRIVVWSVVATLILAFVATVFLYLRAEEQRKIAEEETYKTQIKLADSLIQEKNISAARGVLLDIKSNIRNWEWAYLLSLCGPSPRPLSEIKPDNKYITKKMIDDFVIRLKSIADNISSDEFINKLATIDNPPSKKRQLVNDPGGGGARPGSHLYVTQGDPAKEIFSTWCGKYGFLPYGSLLGDGSAIIWECGEGNIDIYGNISTGDHIESFPALAGIPDRYFLSKKIDENATDATMVMQQYQPSATDSTDISALIRMDSKKIRILKNIKFNEFGVPNKEWEIYEKSNSENHLKKTSSFTINRNSPPIEDYFDEKVVNFSNRLIESGEKYKFCDWIYLNNKKYALIEGNGLEIWDMDTGKVFKKISDRRQTYSHPSEMARGYYSYYSAAQISNDEIVGWFNNNGTRSLAIGYLDGKIKTFLQDNKEEIFKELKNDYYLDSSSIKVSPNKDQVSMIISGRDNSLFLVWDTKTGLLLEYHKGVKVPHLIAWEPNGKFVVRAESNGNVIIQEKFGGKILRQYTRVQLDDQDDQSIIYSPDGSRILILGLVLDSRTFDKILELSSGTTISNDWNTIVTRIDNSTIDISTVHFWNTLKNETSINNLSLKDRLLINEIYAIKHNTNNEPINALPDKKDVDSSANTSDPSDSDTLDDTAPPPVSEETDNPPLVSLEELKTLNEECASLPSPSQADVTNSNKTEGEATALFNNGDIQQSVTKYQEALPQNCRNAFAWANIGVLLYSQYQPETAAFALETAASLKKVAWISNDLCIAHAYGDPPEQMENRLNDPACQDARTSTPSRTVLMDKQFYIAIGNRLFDTGNYAKATETYQKALASDNKRDCNTSKVISKLRLLETEHGISGTWQAACDILSSAAPLADGKTSACAAALENFPCPPVSTNTGTGE